MILVLAGRYDQVRDWAHDKNLNPATYRYMIHPEDFLMYQPGSSRIELVGTWWEKGDLIDWLLTTHWRYELEKTLGDNNEL